MDSKGGMTMSKNIGIVIKGQINSRELYLKIKEFNANVIDMINETYVYIDNIPEQYCDNIIRICQKYGDCDITITKS